MAFRLFKRALAAAGLAAASIGANAAPHAPAAAHPALWQVSDPDTTIYLFGTIHLLPENYQWRSPRFDKAVAKSDALIVETIVDQEHPQELVSALTSLGYSPGQPPIAERVDPAKRPMLEAAIAKSGLPRQAFDRMETWAAAFSLLGTQFKSVGLEGEEGVEESLRSSFGSAGKPVGQLETNREQLSFFDTLSEEAQRALLEGAIQSPGTFKEDFGDMLSGWSRGDVDAIAAAFNRDLADSPELRQALLNRRNANWTRWIKERLKQPGTIMVAVGAGHLAGPDSVQALLQREGIRAKRIQ